MRRERRLTSASPPDQSEPRSAATHTATRPAMSEAELEGSFGVREQILEPSRRRLIEEADEG